MGYKEEYKEKYTMIALRLPRDLLNIIQSVCSRDNLMISECVRNALRKVYGGASTVITPGKTPGKTLKEKEKDESRGHIKGNEKGKARSRKPKQKDRKRKLVFEDVPDLFED